MSCPFSGAGGGPTRRGLLVGAGGALASVGTGALARAQAPGAPQASARAPGAVLRPASGRDRHVKAGADLLRGVRSPRQDPRRRDRDASALDPRREPDVRRRDGSAIWGRTTRSPPRTAVRRLASSLPGSPSLSGSAPGSSARTAPIVMALPPGGRRRWSTCRGSTATNSSPSGPAATFRCRPAPTTRRSRFTPCGELARLSYGVAQVRWAQAGFLPRRRPGRRRAI